MYSQMSDQLEKESFHRFNKKDCYKWLGINGDAIYNSVPWLVQNDTITSGVWYTASADETKVYAMMSWPGQTVRLGVVESSPGMTVSMLGTKGLLQWAGLAPGIVVTLPRLDENTSKWVWTLVITRSTQHSINE